MIGKAGSNDGPGEMQVGAIREVLGDLYVSWGRENHVLFSGIIIGSDVIRLELSEMVFPTIGEVSLGMKPRQKKADTKGGETGSSDLICIPP